MADLNLNVYNTTTDLNAKFKIIAILSKIWLK